MTVPFQKDKTHNSVVKLPPQEPLLPSTLIDKIKEEARVEEMERTEKGRQYLQETSKAKKSLLCYTFNVTDEKENPTGAERTICRKKGSGSITFAWDSMGGNLLKDKPIKKRE